MPDSAPRTDLDDLLIESEMLKAEAKRVVKAARLVVQIAARHQERVEALQTKEVTSE